MPTHDPADLSAILAASSAQHSHLCPRQILGARIALAGAAALGLNIPHTDKLLLIFVESDGCFADGVEVATGCTMGRRTLRLEDYGKIAAVFVYLCPQKRRGAWANPCCRSLERYTQFDNWRSSCNQKPKPGSGLHAVAAGSSGVKLRFLIQRNSRDQEPEGWCRRKGRHREEQTTRGKRAREANSNQVTAFSEQGNGASSAEDRVWTSGR